MIDIEIINDVSKLTAKVKPSWHIVDAPAVIASVVTDGPAIIKVVKSRRIWQISIKILTNYARTNYINYSCLNDTFFCKF